MNRIHREYNCTVPFCNECWAVIKGNIRGVMAVADSLRQVAGNDSKLNDPDTKVKVTSKSPTEATQERKDSI